MNLSVIKQIVTSKAGLAILATQKNSPAILFGAGVIGMVGTVVLASRSTLKLTDTIDEFDAGKLQSQAALAQNKIGSETAKKNNVILHTHLVMDVAKLYLPAVILGTASIGALGGSHYILTRRNAQLTAAVVAIEKAFKQYRGRVVADQGEDKDREYMYGTSSREVLSENKKGEPKVTKVITFGDGSSPYSVVFDNDNKNWQQTPEYNAFFLRQQQNYLNDRLRSKGHIFLNDAYRELGFPDTEAGAVTGWRWQGEGDNFIDFGCWTDNTLEDIREFMRNGDRGILIDFNVDGLIYKNIDKKKG
jgi:Family of unknown function (DUF6353)